MGMLVLRLLIPSGLLLLTSCTAPIGEHASMTPELSEQSRQLHRELNDYRRSKGLAALQAHDGLQQLALDHSIWLRQKRGSSFAHGSNVSHSGSRARARIARIRFGMEAWGENVAYASNTPEQTAKKLITMWKASPAHNEAMLGNWTHAGNAITLAQDGAIFATINFGRQGQP